MKGNSSDLKENNVYGFRKRTTKMLPRPSNTQVSLTQSLFPSKKLSLKNITNKNSILTIYRFDLNSLSELVTREISLKRHVLSVRFI